MKPILEVPADEKPDVGLAFSGKKTFHVGDGGGVKFSTGTVEELSRCVACARIEGAVSDDVADLLDALLRGWK